VAPQPGRKVQHVSAKDPAPGALAAALGATPPPEFATLAAADADTLAETVQRAVAERDASIDRAIDDSLRHLPALLRGPVKRALGI